MCVQIKFPEEYTHIEDNSLRQNDLYPKMNWATTQNLAYTMNFGCELATFLIKTLKKPDQYFLS